MLGRRRRQHEDARGRRRTRTGARAARARAGMLRHLQRADARGGGRRDRGARSRRRSREAGVEPAADLGAAVFSLAGADWPEDFTLLERELRERLGLARRAARRQRRARRAAHRLARLDRDRGRRAGPTTRSARATPTAACSTSASGPTARAGATSGATGLRAVYHAALGHGPADGADRAGARAVRGAPTRSTCCTRSPAAAGWPRPSRTGSRRCVLDVADAGDAVAQAIVAEQGPHRSARQARASRRADRPAARRARASCSPAACSAIRPSGSPTRRWPSCRAPSPVRHRPPPIAGALLLALDRLGVERSTRPRSRPACRSPYPTEGAPHGRDRPRGREQGLPRRRRRRRRRRARDRRRRVHGARRPVGLRQVDAAADDRRARGRVGRDDPDRRPRRDRARAAQPRRRDGVPELRALPAHARVGQPRLRAQAAPHAASRRCGSGSARSPACSGSRS